MRILFLILCLFFTLTGCQRQDQQKKNILKINFQEGDLPSLHPHDLIIYLRGLSIAKTLYEGLTRVKEDGSVELTGAKSVEISPDRLRYSFKLRENRWSDGSAVTAHQYEAAWKEAISPASDCSRADLLYMIKNAQRAKKREVSLDEVGIRAIDSSTLIVDLEYHYPYFFELLSQPICLPLKEPSDHESLIFNGPFKVKSWAWGDLLVLNQNPYFWDRKNTFFDQINVTMIEDIMTAFSLYEKGELDWIGDPLCTLSPELMANLKGKNKLYSLPNERMIWVVLNTEDPALKSPLIRQALSQAIDRRAVTEHILKKGNPLSKPFPSALLASLHSFASSDPKVLLEEGLTQMGITQKELPPIEISYSQQTGRKQLAEYLQETWIKKLGLKVTLKGVEWTTLRSQLEKGLFGACSVFEAAYYRDPLEIMERFITYNPCNFPQWLNETYGKTIISAKYEPDLTKRNEILAEAEKILHNDCPLIPISSDTFLFSHPPHFQGYVFDYVGAIDFSKLKT